MARRVYVLMPSTGNMPFQYVISRGEGWQFVDANRFVVRADDDVIIFVPGTEVSIHDVVLPTRTDREALRAAPYAIEDELAEPVEDVHVALGRTIKSGENIRRELYVCSRVRMDEWIIRAEEAGLKRAWLVAEQSVLPDEDSVIAMGERIMFSCGGKRFVADASISDDVLQAFAGSCAASPVILGAKLAKRLGSDAPVDNDTIDLRQLASWAERSESLTNLRQGSYSNRKSWKVTDIKAWRMPAMLAAACALAWVLVTVVETNVLKTEVSANLAEAQRLYETAFPDEGTVSDPAQRVRAKISNASLQHSEADFMTLSAALYQAIAATDGAAIKSLRFESVSGELRANLRYQNYSDDARIKTALETAGFMARIGDTRQSGGGIVGELVIGGAS